MRTLPAMLLIAVCACAPVLALNLHTHLTPPFQPEPPPDILSPIPEPLPESLREEPFISFETPIDDSEIVEGRQLPIRWQTGGPIDHVRIYYSYDLCPLGGKPRGKSGRVLQGTMLPNTGQVTWTVPWLDTTAVRLRIAGYDSQQQRLAADEIGLRFLPAEISDLPPRSIGIIKKRQRLYYLEGGRLRRMHIVSTAAPGYTTPTMHPGAWDPRRGAMGKIFRKARAPMSRTYRVVMPYWLQITSSGSHGIHATTPRYYSRLGRPASHGCVRQHLEDARILYSMVSVGTPVYVF